MTTIKAALYSLLATVKCEYTGVASCKSRAPSGLPSTASITRAFVALAYSSVRLRPTMRKDVMGLL